MSHTFSRAVAAIALLGSLGACAARDTGSIVEPDLSAGTAVEVHNEAFADMVVYAVTAVGRWRLGMVRGHGTATLEIPRRLVPVAGGLELLADPIGGEPYRLSAIGVSPGQWVEVTLHDVPSLSRISVWTR